MLNFLPLSWLSNMHLCLTSRLQVMHLSHAFEIYILDMHLRYASEIGII